MTQQYEREVEIAQHEKKLAEARAKQAAEKAELIAALEKINKAAAERREAAFSASLQRELAAAGLQPSSNYEPGDVEAVLRTQFNFEVNPDGSFRVKSSTGQYADTTDALKAWASDQKNRKYFSQDSLRLLETPPDKLCKSQMTTAMKTSYISRFGVDAYSALPFNPPVAEVPVEEMTAEAWGKLPLRRRSQILSERGPEWLEEMLRETRRR